MYNVRLLCSFTKLTTLELKTWPKQLLGSLPSGIELPVHIQPKLTQLRKHLRKIRRKSFIGFSTRKICRNEATVRSQLTILIGMTFDVGHKMVKAIMNQSRYFQKPSKELLTNF